VLASSLHELISAVAGDRPSPGHVGAFVSLCERIALVQLRRKVATGRLNPGFFRLPLEDLAVDSIADLLRQDDTGRLVQVAAYFESLSYRSLSDESLLVHLRRLIFAKVNQAMFRMYNELDPSLGKILRNMKLAFQALSSFEVVERFGEQSVVPSACDRLEHLPAIPREELEERVRVFFRPNERIPQLLARLGGYLREQTAHSRLVPLMALAAALRAVYAGDNALSAGAGSAEDALFAEDASKIIAGACRKIRKEYERTYVVTKEVDPSLYRRYFDVIEANILQRVVTQDDGDGVSLYEGLRSLVPGLSRDAYARAHKSRLEYLTRLSYEAALEELKKNF
jgi:hypothetical protein